MELYGIKSKSIPQKLSLIVIELIMIYLVYRILFRSLGSEIYQLIDLSPAKKNHFRDIIILSFCIITFLRFTLMMFVYLKRKMPTEEVFSVSIAFAIYYVGFALLSIKSDSQISWLDYVGIALFFMGSFTNSYSEWQRNQWKKSEENKGKLFTKGLFNYAMHINYFGDVLWVSGFAIVTRNLWSLLIPVLLICFFVFYNIPTLDSYLKKKYKEQFDEYSAKTKKLIPFIY